MSDARVAAELDRIYRRRDFVRRRHANLSALALSRRERILDPGCGTGLLHAELAGAVGQAGLAIGVEPGTDMRANAETTCAGLDDVEILDGGAKTSPVEDGTLDGIISA